MAILHPNTKNNDQEGLLEKLFLIDTTAYFSTFALAGTRSGWVTLIQQEKIIPLPSLAAYEAANEGAQYEQTPYKSTPIRDGRKEFKVMIDTGSDLHKRLRTLKSSGKYGLLMYYGNGCIKGYNPSATTEVRGFSMNFINVEFRTENDGSVAGKTPVFFSFKDASQFEDSPILITPTWNPSDLEALYTVDLAISGTSTATLVTVDVYINHINVAENSLSANPVEGLVTADFSFLTGAGAAQSVTATASSTVPGRYALAGTGLVTGTLNLKTPANMTTTGYKSSAAVAVTIA